MKETCARATMTRMTAFAWTATTTRTHCNFRTEFSLWRKAKR